MGGCAVTAARTVSVKLQADVAGYTTAMDKASKSTKQVGDEADSTGRRSKAGFSMASAAAGGLAVVGVAALGSMVKASMDFDKAMSAVGAAANATGGELEALRKAALKAGADTAFSATEAAQAQTELAKAGVSVRDILGGGLKGALDLASAGQLEVGKAAEIAATAMTQFNLTGQDVPHIADLLAAGAGKAQGSVEDIGMALQQSGLVASQFGLSIEETTGTLAAFASAGLIGSDAGTSLKTMLLALANPAGETAELMKDLGISAYDLKGNFVGVTGLAEQLRTRLGGLTQAQRDQAMAQIFGSDAVRAANVLYKQGASGIEEWVGKTNDAGYAAKTAAALTDNLAGDLERLKGSIETALIQGGSSATGVLRGMAKAADGAVASFSNLPEPVQAGVAGLVALGTAGTGALAAFGTIAPKIREARTSLEQMGRAGEVTSASIGKIGKGLAIGSGVLAGLAAAGAAIKALQDASTAAIPGVETITKSLLAMNSAADLGSKLPAAGRDLEYLGAQIERLANPSLGDQVGKTMANVFTLGQADPQKLRDARDNIGAIDAALAGLVTSGHPERAQEALAKLAEKAGLSTAQVEQLQRVMPQYRDALAGVSNQTALASGETGEMADANGRVTAGLPAATSAIEAQAEAAAKLRGEVDDAVKSLFAMNNVNMSVTTSSIDFKNKLYELSATVKENGTALRENNTKSAEYNAKARANQTAVLALIDSAQKHSAAVGQQTGSEDKARAAFERSIPQIVAQAGKLGLNRREVQKLIDTIVELRPKTVPVQAVVNVVDAIAARVVTPNRTGRNSNSNQGGLARGGEVPGWSPHDRADNINTNLTAGEWVIQKPTVDKLERKQPGIMAAINAGNVSVGGDPALMRLSVGQPIRGQRPQAFADGGLVKRVQSHLDAQLGEPYIWGGVGPTGADCSGYAGQAYGLLTGQTAHRRYFTTANVGSAAGLKPGTGTFTIGVTAGSGHMAFQLGSKRYEATPPRLRGGGTAAPVGSFARQYTLSSLGGLLGTDPGLTDRQKRQIFTMIRPQIASSIVGELTAQKFDTGGWLEPHSATLAINGTGHREPVGDPGAGKPYRTQYRGGGHRGGATVVIPKGAVHIDLSGANGLTESGVERIVDDALDRFADELGAVVGAGHAA